MDAGRFYALLRYEEAALALRAVMHMELIEQMGDRALSSEDVQHEFGFREQASRTFLSLLHVMGVLELQNEKYRVTRLAAECLTEGIPTSRKPYLALGTGDEVSELINLLTGNHSVDALPLYSAENAGRTVMDDDEPAQAIALGLSSRARNFAQPLAAAVATHAPDATSLADIGAGSPYVAHACLQCLPSLQTAMLVDRSNGMRFAHQIIANEQIDSRRMKFCEGDFFHTIPTADVYVVSNTAHDWCPPEYSTIANNIRAAAPANGILCIHEPLLVRSWNNDSEWLHALWMACYALTLLRFTLGQGTCYTIEEHHAILANSGFQPCGPAVPTSDGCTALFYRLQSRADA